MWCSFWHQCHWQWVRSWTKCLLPFCEVLRWYSQQDIYIACDHKFAFVLCIFITNTMLFVSILRHCLIDYTLFVYFHQCFASCTVLLNLLVFLILCSDCFCQRKSYVLFVEMAHWCNHYYYVFYYYVIITIVTSKLEVKYCVFLLLVKTNRSFCQVSWLLY